ncbi:MAG: release factor glutamine methyltransferase [Patescibacteria group bacterium]|nr:release factor glutamine methyltransferase [Patescibacteria group bacterium]
MRKDEDRPYAYRTGKVEFFLLPFKCDERALVPRLETESLVREVLRELKSDDYGTVVDVGTGSGVIAVTIAANRRDLRIVALDRSEAALSLARENAAQNGVAVEFVLSDLLSDLSISDTGPFESEWGTSKRTPERDGIFFVANLPYVRAGATDLSPDTAFEPPEALYGGLKTGFELTRRFLEEVERFAKSHPDRKIAVACEVGDDHEDEIARAARELGRDVRTFADLTGTHRFFTYRIWPS